MHVCTICRIVLDPAAAECPRDGGRPIATAPLNPPAVLGEQFEIGEPLAAGRAGVLFHAVDRTSRTSGILKILTIGADRSEAEQKRLRRELAKQRGVRHAVLLSPLATGEAGGLIWLFREYVQGESLRMRLVRQGALDVHEALGIAAQLAGALDELHRAGLLHRDLKPAHVLLESTRGAAPRVRLADASIATRVDAAHAEILGTAEYVSPEQAAGRLVSFRSDLYALGVMLYEMLAGKLPLTADDVAGLLYAHMALKPPALRDIDLPGDIPSLVPALLSKDPRGRPFSAQHVRRALEPYMLEETTRREPMPKEPLAADLPAVGVQADASVMSSPPPAPRTKVLGSVKPPLPPEVGSSSVARFSRKPPPPPASDPMQAIVLPQVPAAVAETLANAPAAMPAPPKDAPPAANEGGGDPTLAAEPTRPGVPAARSVASSASRRDAKAPRPGESSTQELDPDDILEAEHAVLSGDTAESPVLPPEPDFDELPTVNATLDAADLLQEEPAVVEPVAASDASATRDTQTDVVASAAVPTAPVAVGVEPLASAEETVLRDPEATEASFEEHAPIEAAEANNAASEAHSEATAEPPAVVNADADDTGRLPSVRPGAVSSRAVITDSLPALRPPKSSRSASLAGAFLGGAAAMGAAMWLVWPAAPTAPSLQAAVQGASPAPVAPALPRGPQVQSLAEVPVVAVPTRVATDVAPKPTSDREQEAAPRSTRTVRTETPRATAPRTPTPRAAPAHTETRARATAPSTPTAQGAGAPSPSAAAPGASAFDMLRSEARTHYSAREYAEAAAAYERASAMRPTDPGVFAGLGATRVALGDLPGAIAAYQKAVQLSPDHSGRHAALGRVMLQAGRRAEAIAEYRRAVEFDSNNTAARNALSALGP